MAKDGKYGVMLKKAAKRVENKPLPRCSIPKDKSLRHGIAVGIISALMFGMMCYTIMSQEQKHKWVTQTIQVEFQGSTGLYSGCYDIDSNIDHHARYTYNISSDDSKVNETNIGYCKNDRKWVLFESARGDPCEAKKYQQAAYSAKTDSFDISTSFSETWYSASNEPLDLVFFELGENPKNCNSNLNDGICNIFFNKAEFKFDGGDCCVKTCIHHPECGKDAFSKHVFDMDIDSGYGFPNCRDPAASMKPVVIQMKSSPMSDPESKVTLIFECDNKTLFSIPVNQTLESKMDKFPVPREGNCAFKVGDYDKELSWEMNYTISRASELASARPNKVTDDILRKGRLSTKNTTEYFSVCK